MHCQPLDPQVEVVAERDILEALACRGIVEACGVAHYLRYLPPSRVGPWPEVRLVGRAARLLRPPAWIPRDDAVCGHPLDIHMERTAHGYIFEGLVDRILWLGDARRIRDDLGKLPACYLVVRAVAPVGVPIRETHARQAHDLIVKSAARLHVTEMNVTYTNSWDDGESECG